MSMARPPDEERQGTAHRLQIAPDAPVEPVSKWVELLQYLRDKVWNYPVCLMPRYWRAKVDEKEADVAIKHAEADATIKNATGDFELKRAQARRERAEALKIEIDSYARLREIDAEAASTVLPDVSAIIDELRQLESRIRQYGGSVEGEVPDKFLEQKEDADES